MPVRLQKYLSECGVASRRKAEGLIEEGRVRVNGHVAELGSSITPGVDRVTLGKKPVLPPERGVVLLHKPGGVVTTMSDPGGRPTVAHFLGKKDRGYFPVGRLDFESTGLVVLTNDGDLANHIMHPSYGLERVYEVVVAGNMDDKTVRRLERGVRLSDGKVAAGIKVFSRDESKSKLRVTISVGKNRIVRRIMDHVHHPVQKLKRVAHGPIRLGKLRVGETKRLTESQYKTLRKQILGK